MKFFVIVLIATVAYATFVSGASITIGGLPVTEDEIAIYISTIQPDDIGDYLKWAKMLAPAYGIDSAQVESIAKSVAENPNLPKATSKAINDALQE